MTRGYFGFLIVVFRRHDLFFAIPKNTAASTVAGKVLVLADEASSLRLLVLADGACSADLLSAIVWCGNGITLPAVASRLTTGVNSFSAPDFDGPDRADELTTGGVDRVFPADCRPSRSLLTGAVSFPVRPLHCAKHAFSRSGCRAHRFALGGHRDPRQRSVSALP